MSSPKKELLQFIRLMKQDYIDNKQEWENTSIDT
ncbi:DUF7660 family protein [Bacillus taeanensis]